MNRNWMIRCGAVVIALGLITYFLVNITWVFFRAPDFATAKLLLLSMFGVIEGGAQVLPSLEMAKVAVTIVALVVFHWIHRSIPVERAAETGNGQSAILN